MFFTGALWKFWDLSKNIARWMLRLCYRFEGTFLEFVLGHLAVCAWGSVVTMIRKTTQLADRWMVRDDYSLSQKVTGNSSIVIAIGELFYFQPHIDVF
jgi:hypothetical protein